MPRKHKISNVSPQYNATQTPGMIDRFFDWLKNFVKEKWMHLIFAALTASTTYIVATWKKADHQIDIIAALPCRVDSLSSRDSILIMKNTRALTAQLTRMKKDSVRLDSLITATRFALHNLTTVEFDDYTQLTLIKTKLKMK